MFEALILANFNVYEFQIFLHFNFCLPTICFVLFLTFIKNICLVSLVNNSSQPLLSTTGARDPITSALHIVLGKRVSLDIAQVVRWRMTSASKDEPYVRYAATFAGYHSLLIPFLYLVLFFSSLFLC